jgi:hypothetical protein
LDLAIKVELDFISVGNSPNKNGYVKIFSITFETGFSTAGFVYCELGYFPDAPW